MTSTMTHDLPARFDFAFGRDRIQRETLAQAKTNGRLIALLLLLTVPALIIVYAAAGVQIQSYLTRAAGVQRPSQHSGELPLISPPAEPKAEAMTDSVPTKKAETPLIIVEPDRRNESPSAPVPVQPPSPSLPTPVPVVPKPETPTVRKSEPQPTTPKPLPASVPEVKPKTTPVSPESPPTLSARPCIVAPRPTCCPPPMLCCPPPCVCGQRFCRPIHCIRFGRCRF